MCRVLFLKDQPFTFDFGKLTARLSARGCHVYVAWAITASDNWSNIRPDFHPWLISADGVRDFSPDVIVLDGDPSLKEIPAGLLEEWRNANSVMLYIRARPFRDEEATAGFCRIGFPLARNERGNIGRLATSPNDYRVRLREVVLPEGIWTDSSRSLTLPLLETRGLSYILCPEEGGFTPLLVAPPSYDGKDPVWCHGRTFGLATKPFCFAGIRVSPNWSACFACNLFSDDALELGDNGRFIDAIFDAIHARCCREGL